MAIHEANGAALGMPKMRPAPVWITWGTHTTNTRGVKLRIMHNPTAGLVGRFYSNATLPAGGDDRDSARICKINGGGWALDVFLAIASNLPCCRPVAATHGKIRRVIAGHEIGGVLNFLGPLGLARAKEDVRGGLIWTQIVVPIALHRLVANKREGPGKLGIVIAAIKAAGDERLSNIVHTINRLRLGLGLGKRRKDHRSENGDDGDNDQQFDERERIPTGAHGLEMPVGRQDVNLAMRPLKWAQRGPTRFKESQNPDG